MWYLKKSDDSVYGPVKEPVLKRWAEEGRIAPADRISRDRETWIEPAGLALLEMQWTVELPNGDRYGPIHALALREPLENGEISLTSRLHHTELDEPALVGDVLINALIAQNKTLRTPGAEAALTPDAPMTAEDKTPAQATTPPAADNQWKETAQRMDFFEREATKWKRMYEEERADAIKKEEEAQEELRTLREETLTERRQIEKLQHRLEKLEKSYNQLKQAAETGEDTDNQAAQLATLLDSYNDLSQNYDNLFEQLSAKTQDLQEALEDRNLMRKETEERLQHMRELLQREQQTADTARRRLADMEETHQQLLRSYRDMNDRFIRMREQQRKEKDAGRKPSSGSQVRLHR
jgi:hypothetical protein